MTAIYSVVDGVTPWDQNDVNQYGQALSNVLGITDTGQDALGRLVVPRGNAFPGAPSDGMQFYRTDLGTAGRIYYYYTNGRGWVPHLPMRQYMRGVPVGADITTNSTTMVDLLALPSAFITTGGRLRIYLAAGDAAGNAFISILGGGGFAGTAFFRANVGGTDLSEIAAGSSATGVTSYIVPGGLVWSGYQPAAGSYIIKLRGDTLNAANLLTIAKNCILVVEEYAD